MSTVVVEKQDDVKVEDQAPDRLVVEGTIVTRQVDRDGDVIEPSGVVLTAYEKNPVVLAWHASWLPVGRAVELRVERDRIWARAELVGATDEAKDIIRLVRDGVLRAFSVGFYPLEIVEELPDDVRAEAESWPIKGAYIPRWELVEFSLVSVPAQREALIEEVKNVKSAKVKSWLGRLARADGDPTAPRRVRRKSLASLQLKGESATLIVVRESGGEDKVKPEGDTRADGKSAQQAAVEEKRAVPYRRWPLAPEDEEWDAARARRELRDWSGYPDDEDWPSRYRLGFAWYDEENADTLGAYKLPHHYVRDGRLVTVWRGVAAAMAALLGARGGVNIPDGDREAVYRHLARHYRDFDREPPELREYTREELSALHAQGDIVLEPGVYWLDGKPWLVGHAGDGTCVWKRVAVDDDERRVDALLADVRRGVEEVAAYAELMREELTVIRGYTEAILQKVGPAHGSESGVDDSLEKQRLLLMRMLEMLDMLIEKRLGSSGGSNGQR